MQICCRFTVRKQEVLLNYVGTPQWGPHGDNFPYLSPTTYCKVWKIYMYTCIFKDQNLSPNSKLNLRNQVNILYRIEVFILCVQISRDESHKLKLWK